MHKFGILYIFMDYYYSLFYWIINDFLGIFKVK